MWSSHGRQLMKKLLVFIFLNLLITSNGFAVVYYCADTAGQGFQSADGTVKSYRGGSFKTIKFKADIDFENERLESRDLKLNLGCSRIFSQKWSMSCYDKWGHMFTIAGEKPKIDYFNYTRSKTYGRGDSLVVYYGTCEKF